MRAVISQRVDILDGRNERRDALDQAWGTTLERLVGRSVELLPMTNRPAATAAVLAQWQPQCIVLSGGNDLGTAPERDQTEAQLIDHAANNGLPLLAVCRGMQMLQHHLGGTLVPISGHVACYHTVEGAPGQNLPSLNVNSYHNWGIRRDALTAELQALYLHADGTVEAAHHTRLPWLAVMWHPERSALGEPAAAEWIGRWMREVLA
ncbi:MAG: putative glutamine amidotransferasec [Candidatus Accumulibacter regalis]|jgi:anthranilate/para-aminobenzoate synthase component II|uniref:Glutamine amidotransferasec n=1 Tax=Accumulibacter regalis TaxID=522306 RepID=A0A011PIL2_ACCRE|nr:MULTISPECIES: gamma-glutamyl-gamma-aminobutyrate hydrolase family protein [unclassified Candidatus Accumulibacter]EXI87381.1 MAG: putative glutamine amidotransferasec [Candidatus Accumulibacter regalis]MBL8368305.1 gamma-glutamyl-gamma-aminobutyrate hydrolase family protein [Accumulibacter sp.]HRE72432.1 gamma-glutamyl-gamma-aminobutyrate hydrolase family protein [Accumulibacter sp.]